MDDIRKFPSVLFKNWSCRIVPAIYMNNILALQLKDIDDGSPIATATINLEEHETAVTLLIKDTGTCYTFIKCYSENEGMLKALVDAKIVSQPVAHVSSGYIERIPLVKVLNKELVSEWFNLIEDKLNKEAVANFQQALESNSLDTSYAINSKPSNPKEMASLGFIEK